MMTKKVCIKIVVASSTLKFIIISHTYLWIVLNTIHLYLQDGLKRRMANLKDSIEETNNAVDKEREKNVSLLHLIFPPDIAKRLWLGV